MGKFGFEAECGEALASSVSDCLLLATPFLLWLPDLG